MVALEAWTQESRGALMRAAVLVAMLCALPSEAGAAEWWCQSRGHRTFEAGKCVVELARITQRIDEAKLPDNFRFTRINRDTAIYLEWEDEPTGSVDHGYCRPVKARR
jgi:hypothetical protein